jgi:hypothetical protein
MSKSKPTPGGRAKKNAEISLVRSSAAEYLTFVAASGQGSVEALYADGNEITSETQFTLTLSALASGTIVVLTVTARNHTGESGPSDPVEIAVPQGGTKRRDVEGAE